MPPSLSFAEVGLCNLHKRFLEPSDCPRIGRNSQFINNFDIFRSQFALVQPAQKKSPNTPLSLCNLPIAFPL